MSRHTQEKATRLLAEGKVECRGAALVYDVEGDTGRYVVVVSDDYAACSCPASGECGHLVAAKTLVKMAAERMGAVA